MHCQNTHIMVTDDNHPVRSGKAGSSTPFALRLLRVGLFASFFFIVVFSVLSSFLFLSFFLHASFIFPLGILCTQGMTLHSCLVIFLKAVCFKSDYFTHLPIKCDRLKKKSPKKRDNLHMGGTQRHIPRCETL